MMWRVKTVKPVTPTPNTYDEIVFLIRAVILHSGLWDVCFSGTDRYNLPFFLFSKSHNGLLWFYEKKDVHVRVCSYNMRVLEFLQMISVVIPALNEENYLSEIVWKVTDKSGITRDHTKLLLLNNGSVDETARIARTLELAFVPMSGKEECFFLREADRCRFGTRRYS